MAADFSGTLLDAGRRVNPEFDVLMEISWEYNQDERQRISKALPKEVGLSHPILGNPVGFRGGRDLEASRKFYDVGWKAGREIWGGFVVSEFWDIEPVFGVPFPTILADKFATLNELGLKKWFTRGGISGPPQCPHNINHEVYLELARGHAIDNIHEFLMGKARLWCGGSERAAEMLVKAWLSGEQALESWRILNWYPPGADGYPGQVDHPAAGP